MKTIKKIKNHPAVKKAVNAVLAVIAAVTTLLITALYRAVFLLRRLSKPVLKAHQKINTKEKHNDKMRILRKAAR